MIEKKIIQQKMKEHLIKDFISKELPKSCYSNLELRKTPLGEKILIYTSRPGLVVGGKGSNVQRLTELLKRDFKMENPQIEVVEIDNPHLDPLSIAEKITSSFERFGPKRFKSLGYQALQEIMNAGASGAEIVIGGRGVPSSRARKWRFLAGHLKKSGDISESFVKRAQAVAHLKSGSVGVQVAILTSDIRLPDDIRIKSKEDFAIEVKPVTEQDEIKQQEKVTKKRVRKTASKSKKEPAALESQDTEEVKESQDTEEVKESIQENKNEE
ncbi:MAG TPA: 30S ribosomal protein S3 [Candidatus Nanoarchaeia archaeon]|uniref:30S ribosomal protein S3 n=1 Tax=uncultured organism TaxID=155900 RepID=U3GQE2_9ZZZZ|nr:30S ribosomal protein S3 [uncultured organism]AJS13359.1 30S ribosomal protein S3 [uncultured archaeon]HLC63474.1 30S ribosomal protein S3 [Candidatus Nanoarchaeia archaeon]